MPEIGAGIDSQGMPFHAFHARLIFGAARIHTLQFCFSERSFELRYSLCKNAAIDDTGGDGVQQHIHFVPIRTQRAATWLLVCC
jgi:hypothetical protein